MTSDGKYLNSISRNNTREVNHIKRIICDELDLPIIDKGFELESINTNFTCSNRQVIPGGAPKNDVIDDDLNTRSILVVKKLLPKILVDLENIHVDFKVKAQPTPKFAFFPKREDG